MEFATLVMQGDGNLVMHNNRYNRPVWYSGTTGQCSANCRAVYQTDGNLVLYRGAEAYWSTGSFLSNVTYLRITDSFPFFEEYSQTAGMWGIVPNGVLIEPSSGIAITNLLSFR